MPVYLSKSPDWDPADGQSTRAICVNKENEVLCAADDPDGATTYYIWTNEAADAIDLNAAIPDLEAAIDLNDNRLVLVKLKSGAALLHDLNGGPSTTTTLPSLPIIDNPSCSPPEFVNLDNSGRVLVWWSCPGEGSPPSSVIGYCKPPYKTWPRLTDKDPLFEPVLAESGLILATAEDGPLGVPYYYDLNMPGDPQAVGIPFLQGSMSSFGVYMDANADGWIVGGQQSGGTTDYTPTLYNRKTQQTEGLAKHFGSSWTPSYAVGISGKRIIGEGIKSGQTRGWLLDMGQSQPPDKKKRKFGEEAKIDWRAVYIPDFYLPNPPPEGWLREFFQAMTPEDRRRALTEVQALSASVKRVEKILEETMGSKAP